MSTITNVRHGSDIEWFLRDKVTNEIITAEGLIKGTKDEPYQLGGGFATSLDNVLAEGNIPPVNTRGEWISNIERLKKYLTEMVPQSIALESLADYRLASRYLASDHAKTFGCSPSFLAWTGDIKDNPPAEKIGNLRSAGFHIHTSFDEGSDWDTQVLLIKAMDYYVGVPSVLIEPDSERRAMYGVAGEFRSGACYSGCEYRVLSGFFASSEELTGWAYDQTKRAIDAVNEGRLGFLDYGDRIQQCINTNNKDLAKELAAIAV